MDFLLDEIAYLVIKVKANLISFGRSRFVKLHTKKIKYSVGIIFCCREIKLHKYFSIESIFIPFRKRIIV